MRVPLLYAGLMLGLVLDVAGMEKPGKHDRTRSMPAALHESESSELVLLAADMEEGLITGSGQSSAAGASALDRLTVVSCADLATGCCQKSGTWVYDHKGTLMLLAACGALSFYAGTQLVKMTTMCGAAEDTCSDAITECGTAIELLHGCTGQVTVLSDFIKMIISNGTQTWADAVQQCLATAGMVREAYELCKLCKGGIPAPASFG